MVRRCSCTYMEWVLRVESPQAAVRATFKSIKAVAPLFDRVLVQRFKPETVRGHAGTSLHCSDVSLYRKLPLVSSCQRLLLSSHCQKPPSLRSALVPGTRTARWFQCLCRRVTVFFCQDGEGMRLRLARRCVCYLMFALRVADS